MNTLHMQPLLADRKEQERTRVGQEGVESSFIRADLENHMLQRNVTDLLAEHI